MFPFSIAIANAVVGAESNETRANAHLACKYCPLK